MEVVPPERPQQEDVPPEQPEPEETRTLGQIAAQDEQDLPAIKRRLAQGAGPNDAAEYTHGQSPLWKAATRGHVVVVDALADAGADIGWENPGIGMTALHVAAQDGHAVVVRSLAARGGRAAVDARDSDKSTPLHLAARWGNIAAVQALLEAGADTSLKDRDGMTVLESAVRSLYSKRDREVAACIREADEALRLCGPRQRLAFARSLLASTEAAAGLGELPHDVLSLIGESVVALGPPTMRVVFRADAEDGVY